jgi:glycine/D-amino acid oxidase-like deaminating enzyme
MADRWDAVVVGGGFYGATLACYLAAERGLRRTLLVEREAMLLGRASYRNQARLHNGCHYPRSLTTAYRSSLHLPRFCRDWASAVERDVTAIYAVARRNSRVTSWHFQRLCAEIGATLHPVPESLRRLFASTLIEDLFLVEEKVFDALRLADLLRARLAHENVEVRMRTNARGVRRVPEGLSIDLGEGTALSRYLFNCTYSRLNQLGGEFPGTRTRLKQELTELALLRVPPALQGLAVTVMDGPFFSLMPFPPRRLHTLSHVRYTPHRAWHDQVGDDPETRLADAPQCQAERMLRDAARYLPCIEQSTHVESMFEIKTVLLKNESDDGRPILFEKHADLPGCYSILGGKIDNIYDALQQLDGEPL